MRTMWALFLDDTVRDSRSYDIETWGGATETIPFRSIRLIRLNWLQ